MENQTNQQKEAIILFIELAGFDRLSDKLGSDKASGLFNIIFEKNERIISFAGGRVDKYIGFCQLAVFGSENKAGKITEKALNAALEIREHFNEFVADNKLEQLTGIKMGMNAGPVFTATIGAGDKKSLTVLGETVDKAMRIKDLAAEGKILAGLSCFEAGKDKFSFVALEPIPQPGKKEALRLYELIAVKRTSIHTESARQVVSDMVGRNTEYDLLVKRIRNLMDGKGSIVTISGKAGIGKSRLMAELRNTDLIKKAALHEGRAFSAGQNLSYYPLIQILKSWAGIREEDHAAEAVQKLEHQIRRMFPEQADEIFPFIATLMGYKLSGMAKQRLEGIEGEPLEKLILKNLREMLALASAIRPIVIVIEDMHWIDGSSIAYLESLFKLAGNHRIMFILLMRPGYKETGEQVLKFLEENLRELSLNIFIEPLTESESTDLIVNLLNKTGLPENIRQLIIDKAEGNPFFIEEVIRNFIDEGFIEVKDNHFVVTDKIQTADVPATINEVIVSRIEKLDEKTKSLLKTASAIGRNFYYKVLQEATDTISELDDKLEYLKDVQLINEHRDKEEIEYLFKHALAQQATYESILLQSRKELHLKIARSIEKVFAEKINEFYGTLAYHYTKTEQKEKTTKYLILAGDESLKSGASAEALNFYTRAMDLLPTERINDPKDKEIRDLSYNIAISHHTLGKNDLAVPLYEAIMEKYFNFRFAKTEKGLLARGIISILLFRFMINNQSLFFKKKMTPELDFLMKLFNNWGYAYVHLNPKQFAFKGLKALVFNSLHDIPHSNHALSFFIDTAILFNFTGISLITANKIIEYSERAGVANNPNSFINYRMILIIQHYFSGKWRADKDFIETYQAGLRHGKYWTTFTYVYYSGMCAIELGDYKAFQNRVALLDEFVEILDVTYAMILKYRLATMGYLKFRILDKLREITDTGIDFVRTTGDDANLFMIYCMQAQGLLYMGRINEAKEVMEKVADKTKKHTRVPIFHSQYLLSSLELKLKMLEETMKGSQSYGVVLRDVKNISEKFVAVSKKNPATLTTAYLMKARISHIIQKQKSVYRNLKKAVITGQKYNSRLELSHTYFELGKFLSDPNTKPIQLNKLSGKDYLEKARTMFEEMDLQWDLAEYERFVEH